jgi:hypothetical protein
MDTEIGNPIEYNPDVDVSDSGDNGVKNENNPELHQYYFPPQPMMQQPLHQNIEYQKPDIFANLDKTAYLIIFAAFILGFFMGKTMQPVILRHG